jgi:hypothetical protein
MSWATQSFDTKLTHLEEIAIEVMAKHPVVGELGVPRTAIINHFADNWATIAPKLGWDPAPKNFRATIRKRVHELETKLTHQRLVYSRPDGDGKDVFVKIASGRVCPWCGKINCPDDDGEDWEGWDDEPVAVEEAVAEQPVAPPCGRTVLRKQDCPFAVLGLSCSGMYAPEAVRAAYEGGEHTPKTAAALALIEKAPGLLGGRILSVTVCWNTSDLMYY